MALTPAPRHGRRQVRHPGERGGAGGGGRPRLDWALHESGGKPGFFPKRGLRYDAEEDAYVCPADKLLGPLGKKDGTDRGDKVAFYRARASECASCPLKPRCTTNKNGRQIRRYPGEHRVEMVRAYRETEPYRRAIRKRKVWVEPLFAEAKAWHGMGRFRLRTLWRANAEALLVAAGQNLKRLLSFGDRPPARPAPCAALRRPTSASRGLLHRPRRRTASPPPHPFCNRLARFREGAGTAGGRAPAPLR